MNAWRRKGAWERPMPPEALEVVNYATGERAALPGGGLRAEQFFGILHENFENLEGEIIPCR